MWAFVDSGEVSTFTDTLPASWRNVSNLDALSVDELSALGWRDVAVTQDAIGAGQIAGSPVFTIAGDGSVSAHIHAVPGPVPQKVTNAQMRCALRDLGLLVSIKAAAAADKAAHNQLDPTDDGEFWERWEYGNEFSRQDPFVLQMQAAFEKTDTEMDDLFRLAATK